MDTFVFLTDLANDIAKLPLHSLYYGKPCNFECCGGAPYCPKNFIYMAGQLYFLSLDLIYFATDLVNAMQTHSVDTWITAGIILHFTVYNRGYADGAVITRI
jgi:hypothetical protein